MENFKIGMEPQLEQSSSSEDSDPDIPLEQDADTPELARTKEEASALEGQLQ